MYITDWLMVGITFVYAVVTVLILIANNKSAKVAKEQVDEMQREFEESNRPRIEVELQLINRCAIVLRFCNNGRLTAKHVRIALEDECIDSLPEQEFAEQLRNQKGKECIIGAGQHYDMFLGTSALIRAEKKPIEGYFTYTYNDCDKTITEDFYIDINNYNTFFTMDDDTDKLLKILREHTKEIKGIKEALEKIEGKLDDKNNEQ